MRIFLLNLQNTFVITDICPAVDNCGNDTVWTNEKHKPVYERNEAVFIGVVTLAAICLIVLFIGLLLIRCSKRGTWVLEHCDEVSSAHLPSLNSLL